MNTKPNRKHKYWQILKNQHEKFKHGEICIWELFQHAHLLRNKAMFGDCMFHNYWFELHENLSFQAEEARSEDVWLNMSAASNHVFSAPLALHSLPPDLF